MLKLRIFLLGMKAANSVGMASRWQIIGYPIVVTLLSGCVFFGPGHSKTFHESKEKPLGSSENLGEVSDADSALEPDASYCGRLIASDSEPDVDTSNLVLNLAAFTSSGTRLQLRGLQEGFNSPAVRFVDDPQSRASFYAYSYFTQYNGTSFRYPLIRICSNGAIDTSFNFDPPLPRGAISVRGLSALPLKQNKKIIVFLIYQNAGGESMYETMRLDLQGHVEKVVSGSSWDRSAFESPDGFIFASPTSVWNGESVSSAILKLNTDLEVQSDFNIPRSPPQTVVGPLVGVKDGSRYFFIGKEPTAPNVPNTILIKIDSHGNRDPAFRVPFTTGDRGPNTNIELAAARMVPDGSGDLYLAGSIAGGFNIASAENMIRVDSKTGELRSRFVLDARLRPLFSSISTFDIDSDGNIWIGGWYEVPGVYPGRFAKINSSGEWVSTNLAADSLDYLISWISTTRTAMPVLMGGDFQTFNE